MPATVQHGYPIPWAQTIEERRQHIADLARCRDCGTDAATCRDDATGDASGPGSLCCWSGSHGHIEDPRMLDQLMKEIMAGEVRTVAEAYPPPTLGPRMVDFHWLIWQNTWWYPYRRPALRVAEMDRAHRYSTANWLGRRAWGIVSGQEMRMVLSFQPSGDMACDAFERELDEMREDPVGYLDSTPLMVALRKGLPTGGRKLAALAERARHWSTCPMRLKREQRNARDICTCPPPRPSSTETYPEP